MAKKEFLDNQNVNSEEQMPQEMSSAGSGFWLRLAGLTQKVFAFLKLLCGLMLLPVVYAATVSFLKEAGNISAPKFVYFWYGVASFLILYLFIWEPRPLYSKGQQILSWMFGFFKPFVKVAPYLLPIYVVLAFIFYWPARLILHDAQEWFLLFSGFGILLHVVFGAKSLCGRQQDFLKANYLFGVCFIYLVGVYLVSLLFSFVFERFSFIGQFNYSLSLAGKIFFRIFKQLFL